MALMGLWITDILRRQRHRLKFQVCQTTAGHQRASRTSKVREATDLAATDGTNVAFPSKWKKIKRKQKTTLTVYNIQFIICIIRATGFGFRP